MKYEFLIALGVISLLIYRLFSSFSLRPPRMPRKYLFLNPVIHFAIYSSTSINLRHYKWMSRITKKINDIFRINLIKPCKCMKKVISCCSYDTKRTSCQYHGIRYWVRPEMEFGNRYQPLLGWLNVKQSTQQFDFKLKWLCITDKCSWSCAA